MGLLKRVVPGGEKRSANDPYVFSYPNLLFGQGYAPAFTGKNVTVQEAYGLIAVRAAVEVLAKNIGSLPFVVYRDVNGEREPATETRLYKLCHEEPHPQLPAGEFFEIVVRHLALYGNAYIQKMRDGMGLVTALWPIDPSRVVPQFVDGKKTFSVVSGAANQTAQKLDDRAILHIRLDSLDGVWGRSPIESNRQQLAILIAQQEYVGRYYANSATPGGILTPGENLGPEVMKDFLASWESAQRGVQQAGKTAVLPPGSNYTPMSAGLSDQQFLEQRRFGVQDVARMFGLPPWILGEAGGSSMTYKTVEQEAQHFVKFSLRPWAAIIERAIAHDGDLGAEDGLRAEFDFEDLLRSDFAVRVAALVQAVSGGIFTPNEARERLNEESVPGGDSLYEPSGPVVTPGDALEVAPEPEASE
jgi:HK97 family phage portal protein